MTYVAFYSLFVFASFSLAILTNSSSSLQATNPTLNAAVNQREIDLVRTKLINVISKNLTNITFPDFEIDIKIGKIYGKSTKMYVQPLKPDQVNFQLTNDSNEILIQGSGLTLNGSTDLRVKVILSHSCKAIIRINKLGFSTRIALGVSSTGKLQFTVKSTEITLSKNDIEIKLIGDILDDIINFIIGAIKSLFFDLIKKIMNSMLPGMITSMANDILNKIPDDLAIGETGLMVKFGFPKSPEIKSGYLKIPVHSFFHKKGSSPSGEPKPIPELNLTCPKGIQVYLHEYILQSGLEAAAQVGLLKYSLSKEVMVFVVDLTCWVTKPPGIYFMNGGNVRFNASVNCNATIRIKNNPDKIEVGFITAVNGMMHEWIKNATAYFEINSMAITDLQIIFGQKIDLKQLTAILNFIIEALRNTINREVGLKGIKLPEFPMMDYQDLEQHTGDGYVFVCLTAVPKLEGVRPLSDYLSYATEFLPPVIYVVYDPNTLLE